MRSVVLAFCGLILAAFIAPAQADVRVIFAHPEAYTDADAFPNSGASAREPTMAALRQYIVRQGRQYLRPGQTLNIEITDIDLAGAYIPSRRGADIRVIRSITPPRIALRYTLQDGKRVISRGEDVLREQMFQPVTSIDTLKYEKAMLDDWFRGRFSKAPL
jgi:hypothetical protein